MITLQNFKKMARIYVPPTPASGSAGIAVFTKNPPSNAVVTIPKDTLIHTASGITFKTAEDLELNESETFQPVACVSTGQGSATNIPANQTWSVGLPNLDVTNPAPFSGGNDSDPGIPSPNHLTDWIPPSDDVLQANIDLAKKNVLTKLGNPAQLPDEPALDRAVVLFAQFYTQNISMQESISSFKGDNIERKKTEYYRERLFRAINREVDNLILPFVDVLKFMPEVSA